MPSSIYSYFSIHFLLSKSKDIKNVFTSFSMVRSIKSPFLTRGRFVRNCIKRGEMPKYPSILWHCNQEWPRPQPYKTITTLHFLTSPEQWQKQWLAWSKRRLAQPKQWLDDTKHDLYATTQHQKGSSLLYSLITRDGNQISSEWPQNNGPWLKRRWYL